MAHALHVRQQTWTLGIGLSPICRRYLVPASPNTKAACHAAVMELRPATHETPVRRAPELQQDAQAQGHRESRILRQGQASLLQFSWVVASAVATYGGLLLVLLYNRRTTTKVVPTQRLWCCSATASSAMLKRASAKSGDRRAPIWPHGATSSLAAQRRHHR